MEQSKHLLPLPQGHRGGADRAARNLDTYEKRLRPKVLAGQPVDPRRGLDVTPPDGATLPKKGA